MPAGAHGPTLAVTAMACRPAERMKTEIRISLRLPCAGLPAIRSEPLALWPFEASTGAPSAVLGQSVRTFDNAENWVGPGPTGWGETQKMGCAGTGRPFWARMSARSARSDEPKRNQIVCVFIPKELVDATALLVRCTSGRRAPTRHRRFHLRDELRPKGRRG